MPCKNVDETNVHPSTPSPFPGSGNFAPQIPALNIPFPPTSLPDLGGLFDVLGMILPPGTLKPHFEPDFLNTTYGAINSLLEKFMPFLMIYKFFLPVLNLILCIIEVLCSIPHPFKLIRAMKRLFRTCIPEFLAIFPFFALILMIISLLLLIIALIDYLIDRIKSIVEIILANIKQLSKAALRADNDSIISTVKKIGDLLCTIQNLFVIFGVMLSVIQIIETILSLNFTIPPCDDQNGTDSGCCTPDVCPDFIKNNETIVSSDGYFLYYNEVGQDSGLTLPPGFPPIVAITRNESWQFYDPSLAYNKAFINITRAYDMPAGRSTVFFPSGATYNKNSAPSSAPYTISFRFLYDPTRFGSSGPKRYIRIVNAIIQSPPVSGVASYDGHSTVGPLNGTLNLVGGIVQEDNGAHIVDGNGNILTINDFIHLPTRAGTPTPFDGVLYENIEYTFTINHEILVGAALITLGCVPELAEAKNFINATIGAQFNINGNNLFGTGGGTGIVALLPDIAGAQDCITNVINTYRGNVSEESTAIFQTDLLACLNDLRQQSTTVLSAVITAGFDQYKSDFSFDTSIQFTTLPIKVSVSLNESSGQPMTTNLPIEAATALADQLTANITFGTISKFVYDGYALFNADINSKDAGNGKIKVAFNNNYISILSNPVDLAQTPSVSVKELDYTFVKSPIFGNNAGGTPPRRDEGDVSRDGNLEGNEG